MFPVVYVVRTNMRINVERYAYANICLRHTGNSKLENHSFSDFY